MLRRLWTSSPILPCPVRYICLTIHAMDLALLLSFGNWHTGMQYAYSPRLIPPAGSKTRSMTCKTACHDVLLLLLLLLLQIRTQPYLGCCLAAATAAASAIFMHYNVCYNQLNSRHRLLSLFSNKPRACKCTVIVLHPNHIGA
jgi:hypothetical protein